VQHITSTKGGDGVKKPKAPQHMPKYSPGWMAWHRILDTYVLEDPEQLLLLEQACECLNRIQQAREAIEQDGPFVRDRFSQIKEHPGQKTERDNKVLFTRIVRELNLSLDLPEEYSRPKRLY